MTKFSKIFSKKRKHTKNNCFFTMLGMIFPNHTKTTRVFVFGIFVRSGECSRVGARPQALSRSSKNPKTKKEVFFVVCWNPIPQIPKNLCFFVCFRKQIIGFLKTPYVHNGFEHFETYKNFKIIMHIMVWSILKPPKASTPYVYNGL